MNLDFRFWSGSRMFYSDDPLQTSPIMDCMKDQIYYNLQARRPASYDHIGIHGAAFMMWIGLLDSEGKKIYEGDLVASIWNDEIPLRQVIFQAPAFVVKSPNSDTWTNFMFHPEEKQVFKVVGNIYENPDLLT